MRVFRRSPTRRTRSRNGPGCPWVILKLQAGAWWSGKELVVDVGADLPDGVSLELEGWIYKAWWQEAPRTFAPPEREMAWQR